MYFNKLKIKRFQNTEARKLAGPTTYKQKQYEIVLSFKVNVLIQSWKQFILFRLKKKSIKEAHFHQTMHLWSNRN